MPVIGARHVPAIKEFLIQKERLTYQKKCIKVAGQMLTLLKVLGNGHRMMGIWVGLGE